METKTLRRGLMSNRYGGALRDAKEKIAFSSDSKVSENQSGTDLNITGEMAAAQRSRHGLRVLSGTILKSHDHLISHPSVISGVPLIPFHAPTAFVQCKTKSPFPTSANVAVPFIDRSNKLWNFRHLTICLEKGEAMRKPLMALAAVVALAVSAGAAPAHAQRGFGAGLAAGVIGGAIVGGALARPGYYGPGYGYYGPGYGYYGQGAYVADDYYGGCVWQSQRFWDGYGWRVRRVRVCG